ncbi:ABC-type multidrug transport system fused ATPase/permease subunit [Treponema pedis]
MDTIYENIKFGNPSACEEEIISAAKKAGAHNFIMQTEDGYKTIIGGKESKLSGGQAQRITIARAILKKSPVLIMDEPTSALDGETEKDIIDLIKEYKGTVIYISHRNELIQAADKVLRLDNGFLI